jgi:uncharacterized protein YbaA (DUF1428 family)
MCTANVCADAATDFGAVEICEYRELDVPGNERTDSRKALKLASREGIVMARIIRPDRETAARAHREMSADPCTAQVGGVRFDDKRMIRSGFESVPACRNAWRPDQISAGFIHEIHISRRI